MSDLGGRPATRCDRKATTKAGPSTEDWEQGMRQVFPPGVNCHWMGTANTAHECAPPARAEASGRALGAMYLPTDNLGRRRIGGQRPRINGDRMHKGRCRGELERNARRLAGPGLGLGPSTLHASRPAALDDDSAGFALHFESLFLDDSKDREGHLGSSEILPTSVDNFRSQCGSKGRTSLIGRVVAESVALTDIVCRSLFGGEVGLNPTDGVGPEQ